MVPPDAARLNQSQHQRAHHVKLTREIDSLMRRLNLAL
jgi:hypothetical protein